MNAVSLTAGSEQEEILYSVINILDAYKKTMPIIKVPFSSISPPLFAFCLYPGSLPFNP